MPLSEQEQRLLEEMERSLYHNDADFVASVSSRRGKPAYSTVVTGVLIAIVGIVALIAGVVIRQPIVGVVGFVAMFAGVLISLTPPRGGRASSTSQRQGAAPTTDQAPSAETPRGPSFLQNLNERWEKRQEERDE
jgi:hypothetical protein